MNTDYMKWHPVTAKYTSFSSARGPLFRIDHMLGHKISLNKFKRTKIGQIMFSNYSGMELEINNKNKLGNS